MPAVLARTAVVVALVIGAPSVATQRKLPVPPSDYGKFETLLMQPRGGLSPDGRWIAYGVNRSSRDNELRISNVADGSAKTIPFGSQVAFSADSQWTAYSIGYSEAQEEKLRQDKKPIHRKLGLLKLASGEMTTIDGIETFAFNASGTQIGMKRYAPERPGQPTGAQPPAAPSDEPPTGATLIVRHLATGRDTTFGNVTEYTWQDKGGLLALAIGAEDKAGNGIQLFDPESGSLRVLDSAAASYSGLTWRKEADDLAALRSKTDDRRDGQTHVALAWKSLRDGTLRTQSYDPSAAADFPAGLRIVSFRRPSWSDDGRTVFLGIAPWDEKAQDTTKPNTTEDGDGAQAKRPARNRRKI